jgi:hypothetical protein
MAFVFANPTPVDLVQRHRIEIMQLLASTPNGGNQVRLFQNDKMLGHCLPRHVEQLTQLAERLPIVLVQFVEQFSTARIGQRFEHFIHDRLTICNLMVACQARKLIALYARDARRRRLQPNSACPFASFSVFRGRFFFCFAGEKFI